MPLPPIAKLKSTSTIKPRQTMRGDTSWVVDVAHLPDGRRIVTCSFDGSLRLWDLESGTQIGNDWRDGEGDDGGDGDRDEEGVWTMELSPNGKRIVSGSKGQKVRLWDVGTEKVVAKWTGNTDIQLSLCWSVDGERVVSGSYDGTIRGWDVESGDTVLVGPIKTGHQAVAAAIYSPNTRWHCVKNLECKDRQPAFHKSNTIL